MAPIMLGPDGLRRGVQIIAANLEDRTAIASARMVEMPPITRKQALCGDWFMQGVLISMGCGQGRDRRANAATRYVSVTAPVNFFKNARAGLHGINFLQTSYI